MKRRGYDFARTRKLRIARSEDADFLAGAPAKKTPAATASSCEPASPAARRPASSCTPASPAARRPVRSRAAAKAATVEPAADKPAIDMHGIVPVGQMPNGTIKATINEKTIYIAATVNPKPRGMVATYRLAGKYFGLSAEQYARVKADCPAVKKPTEAELALRKIKIMFAHAESLIENQGEYFRTIGRAEKARADWEAKYPEAAKKHAAAAEAEAMTQKWLAKDETKKRLGKQ